MDAINRIFIENNNFANHVYDIYKEAIFAYHILDHISQKAPAIQNEDDLREMFQHKSWIDIIQWHIEDEIRKPDIQPQDALQLKRRIDVLNQERTNMVESIDKQILLATRHVTVMNSATVNTETPAWALDRLSVLALKIYHMDIEANRNDAPENHLSTCEMKLQILYAQKNDLIVSINELVNNIICGSKIMKLYNQMKMYNDPNLNPVLYKL